MKKRILVIAAHPDDEVLGCAGTVAKLIREGYEAFSLVLGEGVTSRDLQRDPEKRKNEIRVLHRQLADANKRLGIKEVFTCNFPDNRFDSVPLLEIVKEVENIKKIVRPDVVFTHYENDLNIDHQIAFRAVLTATRPLKGETVKKLYSFEIPSSTAWRYPLSFSPDMFVDISKTISLKLRSLSAYKSEMRAYPHPRSLKAIRVSSAAWGIQVGVPYAEVFKTVRVIS